MLKTPSKIKPQSNRHQLMEKRSPLCTTPSKLSLQTDRSYPRGLNKQIYNNNLYSLASDVKIVPNITSNVFGYKAIEQIFKCLKILQGNDFLKLQTEINGIYFLMKAVQKKVNEYYNNRQKMSQYLQLRTNVSNFQEIKIITPRKSQKKQKQTQISGLNSKIGDFHLNQFTFTKQNIINQSQNIQQKIFQKSKIEYQTQQSVKKEKNIQIRRSNQHFNKHIYLQIEEDSNF